jgi:hypothetical protein
MAASLRERLGPERTSAYPGRGKPRILIRQISNTGSIVALQTCIKDIFKE